MLNCSGMTKKPRDVICRKPSALDQLLLRIWGNVLFTWILWLVRRTPSQTASVHSFPLLWISLNTAHPRTTRFHCHNTLKESSALIQVARLVNQWKFWEMADWVHCNSCYVRPGGGKLFSLTNCGHIYCADCLQGELSGKQLYLEI